MSCDKENCKQEKLTPQQKIDKIVEDKQLKHYTEEHIDEKYRLEAENELLALELANIGYKAQLEQAKLAKSNIKLA